MLKIFFKLFLPSLLFIFLSCSEIGIKEEENSADVIPPKITDLRITDSVSAEFDFSRNIQPLAKVFNISPDIGISDLLTSGSTLKVVFTDSQLPGSEYYIKGAVKDTSGNTLTFCAEFYGYNPFIPSMIINEVTTQGSSTHPDMVELFIKSDGNMAGAAFFEGTDEDSDSEYIFPSMEVSAGDYIIIHAKPEGTAEEITETDDKTESGGIDASDSAFDIWPSSFSGLSGNNGVLSLYSGPGGSLLDAFLYSNRTSSSDESYRGFGSLSVMKRMDYIAACGGWLFSGDLIAPEDCVDPDPSTATRSVCRNSVSDDTDSRSDWHTAPTSMSSFGAVNTDEVYVP